MAPRKLTGRSSHPTEPCRRVGEGGRGATRCQGHPLMPTPSSAPARCPMPRVEPFSPSPGEGSSWQMATEERVALLPAAHPGSAVFPSPVLLHGDHVPWYLGGGGAVPAGLGSLLPVPCARVGPPPPAPRPAHPAVLLLPTLWLAPKCWVPSDEGLTGPSVGPLSPGSGGGATPGQSPLNNPIQEPVPSGLEILYI